MALTHKLRASSLHPEEVLKSIASVRKGKLGSLILYVLVLLWKCLIVLKLEQLLSLVKKAHHCREIMALKVQLYNILLSSTVFHDLYYRSVFSLQRDLAQHTQD